MVDEDDMPGNIEGSASSSTLAATALPNVTGLQPSAAAMAAANSWSSSSSSSSVVAAVRSLAKTTGLKGESDDEVDEKKNKEAMETVDEKKNVSLL